MNKDTKLIKQVLDNLQILSEKKKRLSKKQMKIAQAAPPPDEITGADFKALNKKKKNETLEDVLESYIQLQENPKSNHHPNYAAPEGSKRDKQLDKFKNMLKKAKELAKKGKTGEANKLKQKVYDGRDKMEKEEREKKNETTSITSYQLKELVNEAVEAEKLAIMLEKIEELEEKKKRKKKKKKKKGGGLSAAVKKSLDKKADKTRIN